MAAAGAPSAAHGLEQHQDDHRDEDGRRARALGIRPSGSERRLTRHGRHRHRERVERRRATRRHQHDHNNGRQPSRNRSASPAAAGRVRSLGIRRARTNVMTPASAPSPNATRHPHAEIFGRTRRGAPRSLPRAADRHRAPVRRSSCAHCRALRSTGRRTFLRIPRGRPAAAVSSQLIRPGSDVEAELHDVAVLPSLGSTQDDAREYGSHEGHQDRNSERKRPPSRSHGDCDYDPRERSTKGRAGGSDSDPSHAAATQAAIPYHHTNHAAQDPGEAGACAQPTAENHPIDEASPASLCAVVRVPGEVQCKPAKDPEHR